mmetsp:Transcript_75540/g.136182  ORF Transcript_75540/g.136182 Transcript_75540/m.136182 type:complete len:304 (+) Transcript_75540:1625-2536(+)
MHVATSCCNNHLFSSNGLRGHSHSHAWGNACHDVGVASLPYAHDAAPSDANVGLDNAKFRIYDEGVGDHHIEGMLRLHTSCLSHTFTQHLATSELALISIGREVLLDLGHEIRVPEPYLVAYGRPKEVSVLLPRHDQTRARNHWAGVLVAEAASLHARHDFREALRACDAIHQAIARDYAALTSNLHQCDYLCVSRLEPHRGARGHVEASPIRLCAVEHQCLVGLDEVIMGSHLDWPISSVRDTELDERAARIQLYALRSFRHYNLPRHLPVYFQLPEGGEVRLGQEGALESQRHVAINSTYR